jgi:magnesium transporter
LNMIPETDAQKTAEAGLAPDTLILQGEKKVESTTLTTCEYTEQVFQEKVVEKIEDAFPLKSKPAVTWINITGIHDVSIIEKLGSNLSIHPLVLEDILSTNSRPKVEDHTDYMFIILKALSFDSETDEMDADQVSIIVGSNFVISIQEKNDIFDPIRKRIRNPQSRHPKMGTGYLAYTLIDLLVDNYFKLLEKIEDRIESLEEELVNAPTSKTLQVIHQLKNELILLRKSIWPVREVVNSIERSESILINKALKIYLRDVYDHVVQIIESIESLRDMVSGMLDIYLSSVSNRMNAVMKVLTIIATIFIPLTFIVGIRSKKGLQR